MSPFLTFSILTFILIGTVTCQPSYLYHFCISDDTSGGNYQSNLASILGSLSSKASQSSFNTTTSSGIYTLYLCRGDVNSSTCQTCVSKAAQEITQWCPSSDKAIIWYDECMLWYMNLDLFGEVLTDPNFFMYNVKNTTSPQDPDVKALALIFSLISNVQSSPMLFETGTGDGLEKRYGMVQCTRDIDGSQCYSCLVQLSKKIDMCCQGKVGWRIISPSCYLRYEEYLFYQESSSSLPPESPQPESPPPELPPPKSPPPAEEGNGQKSTTKIVAIIVPSVAAVAALSGFLCYWSSCRKRRQQDGRSQEIPFQQSMEGMSMERRMHLYSENSEDMQYFNLSTIVAATDGFSDANKLGEGGFGPVYKGKLLDGEEIAVKRLSIRSSQGMEEFKNEVVLIVKLQHRNLVRLLGCCIEGEEKILVYEYLPNRSLDAFLFDPTKSRQLEWTTRAQIVNGIARGLLYLHEDSRLKIIHRDLKASNVLLDDEMQPKISDFGTARIFGGNQIEANTARVVGTYGYMAPEYAMEGLFSVKSDVYSFGILVLEIISGKKSSGFYGLDQPQSLLSYAWQLWKENRGMELVDANLVKSCPVNKALRWIHVALLCVQEDLKLRPMMSSVVLMLGSDSDLPQPKPPPSLVGRLLGSDQSTSTGVGAEFLSSDMSTITSSC